MQGKLILDCHNPILNRISIIAKVYLLIPWLERIDEGEIERFPAHLA